MSAGTFNGLSLDQVTERIKRLDRLYLDADRLCRRFGSASIQYIRARRKYDQYVKWWPETRKEA